MTNPGDSDEWWKQYGGSGVSPESGAPGSVPQYPTAPPSQPSQPQSPSYPSAPQYPQQSAPPPSQPQYPNYQQPQAGAPQYPQQPGYGGYPQAGGYQPYGAYPQPQGTNGLAIASLVTSLIGMCTCIGSIVGIVLGVMALNQLKERGGEGRGMALAGIWIGAITLVLGLLYVVFVMVLGFAGGWETTSTY